VDRYFKRPPICYSVLRECLDQLFMNNIEDHFVSMKIEDNFLLVH
jgi:hypothetical protein